MGESTADEILMAAYQAGNEMAFRELFDRYAGRVYGFLLRRAGDPALAEDLSQETFLRVHRARASYDSNRSFRAWLFAIVHNLLADTLRRRERTPRTSSLDDPLADPTIAWQATEQLVGKALSPENVLIAQQMNSALDRALRTLTSDEATVIMLARFEGLSYEDISQVVGRSALATKQLAYRALKQVRQHLRDGVDEGQS